MPEIAVGGWLFQIKQFEEKRIEKVYALRQPEALEAVSYTHLDVYKRQHSTVSPC